MNSIISSTHFPFSIKPFQNLKPGLTAPALPLVPVPPSSPWIGRSIATAKLRLLEHSAFVDYQSEHDSYHKHLFVHIGSTDYSDPILEVNGVNHCVCLCVSCFLAAASGRAADPGQVSGKVWGAEGVV